MIETINPQLLFGAAGIFGAGLRGLVGYFVAKKKDKTVKFDLAVYSDTLLKGIATGLAFSIGLPVTWVVVGVTALAATGVDTYFNKFGISIIPTVLKYFNISRTAVTSAVTKITRKKKK
jgi:hypothetical protein